MPLVDINGVQVNFPFTPYPCQIDYMAKVLTCLQKNENGILESPTGTGKTLSLLCSSLAWQESHKAQVELNKQAGVASTLSPEALQNIDINKILQTATGARWGTSEFLVPKIIYASRTHSQLSQAVQELKRTAYNHVKSSVIGSREQLCIHQQVQKLTNNAAKVHMCKAKVSTRNCHFYNNIEEFKKKSDIRKVLGSVVDIEDVVKAGHKTKTCPYYMARELKSDSDIVFMPYNYLLDSKSRKAHGVELQGSVIIFDEAHNLEKICEESASFDLSSLDIATAIEETTKLAEKIAHLSETESEFSQIGDSAIIPDFNLEEVIRLKQTLLDLEEKLDKIQLSLDGKTYDGSFIFDFLSQVNITWSTKNSLLEVLDRMTSFLGNDEGNALLHTKGSGLMKFSDCLKIVFNQEPNDSMSLSNHQSSLSQHFKVFIQKKDNNIRHNKKNDVWAKADDSDKKVERILSYWCFSPGYTMRDLVAHGVKVIILTSGTLSPLNSFSIEMQIPFPVRLENPHVISKNQVWLGVLCKGPDGVELNSEYRNRTSEEYLKSLGNTIVNFTRLVPNGLLIFFPSYPMMEICIEKWKMTRQWDMITQRKPVIVEPKGKTAFTEAMDEFYSKVNDSNFNGAIFMAVCRGKVSEGLDFADINGRAVMITGLPFPPFMDPRVKLKMEFLGNGSTSGLNGRLWYSQQATRAVNQAIGRVIRHSKDFGAIILCDSRFSQQSNINALPLWVRKEAKIYNTIGPALKDISKFFKEAEITFPNSVYKPVKNKPSESGIVSGVSFEPSFTRTHRAHISVQYERACDVPCHIPSLKIAEEALYGQYSAQMHTKVKTQCAAKKRSLLEALETDEEEQNTPSSHQSVVENVKSSTQMPSQPDAKKLPGKQKRIKIKPRTEVIIAESKKEAKLKEEEIKARLSEEMSKQYISEIKTTVGEEKYREFSTALKLYRREKNIEKIVPVLAALFTGSVDHYHLLQKFYRFIQPKDKEYFARTCYELTNLTCAGKHHTNNTCDLDQEKFTAGWGSSECLESKTTTIGSSFAHKSKCSLGYNKEFRGYIPHYHNNYIKKVVNLEPDGSVKVETRICNGKGVRNEELQRPDFGQRLRFKYDDRELYQELVDSGTIDPEDGIFTPDMFVYPRSWKQSSYTFIRFSKGETIFSTCVICDQLPVNGLRHECGAVCCFMCWKSKVFDSSPERKCPYPHCEVRVKRKHLQPVKPELESTVDQCT